MNPSSEAETTCVTTLRPTSGGSLAIDAATAARCASDV
eukprot:CAMPEP_0119094962 /NCGR_PEP_ID=MMETSP1178-20130426/168052_1 /TAXON_ID=33656 /ORGANISM="unid sp, Strain CCMP2000" /LENGTH=37 /DNA_ID= /DNA_START= /DNA_END= /DNA_ORIENTATION=